MLLAAGVLLLTTSFLVRPQGGEEAPPPKEVPEPAQEEPGPAPAPLAEPEAEAAPAREGPPAGCHASPADQEGFPASRSLSFVHRRDVETNATSLSAFLALAGPLVGPVTPEDVTSVVERSDEVCLFTPYGWQTEGSEALLVRFVTTHERNVSLSRDVAIHLLALGGHGKGFRADDVLDVEERGGTVRLVELRVPPAPDEDLLRLARSAPAPQERPAAGQAP